ncbi:glycosidase [Arthrobacter sp. M4]|uniref:pullulanase X25 domain-containing protein n=1 Tax=Arthrobacter sp. M4 TaxID=218160 RepID=UPI001CDD856D|nr:glycosidase [Arthrobacter sp. M4]MCA4133973.1 glycosidase [Arthrobacter sp. M4]
MAKSTLENTNARLKVVLDVLEEEVWSGSTLNAGQVLAEAIVRVPFTDHEGELLSGGIPRGHKNLTTATAKLVKAGWLVKGRSGWSITDEGRKATVAFPSPEAFDAALTTGTPVPEDTPLPAEAPKKPVKKVAAAKTAEKATAKADKKAPAKKTASKAAQAVEKAAEVLEEAVAPVAKAVRSRKAAKAKDEAPAAELVPQPEAVAVAGNFNILLGSPEDWAPQYDQAQMGFEAESQVWKITADLPAGAYLFKIALNRSWDENYGAFGAPDGANHELHHAGGPVTITYSHATKDIVFS